MMEKKNEILKFKILTNDSTQQMALKLMLSKSFKRKKIRLHARTTITKPQFFTTRVKEHLLK